MIRIGRGAANWVLVATGLSLTVGCSEDSPGDQGVANAPATGGAGSATIPSAGVPPAAGGASSSTTTASTTSGPAGSTAAPTGRPPGGSGAGATGAGATGAGATGAGATGMTGAGATAGTGGTGMMGGDTGMMVVGMTGATGTGGMTSMDGMTAMDGMNAAGGMMGEMMNEEPPAAEDYNPDFKEFVGEDCDLPEPMLLSSPDHSLPDPFLMPDGERMSSVSQWACQRAWLKKNIEAFVHGEKPGRPDTVTGSVSATSVQVHVEHGGSSTDFSVSISLPANANGAVPAMFKSGNSGVPNNVLHGEMVAAINYDDGSLETAFDQIYGGGGRSNQVKWAWGISRVIDVLVDERDAGSNDIIDPTGLGTTGCSRNGKSAFTVGAFDERIALGIPMESGTGGLGSYRVVADMDRGPNGGEDPEQVNEACSSGWLTANACSGNVDAIPADAHFMVAMYAPRGFTTLENNRIGHLAPVAGYAAAAAGAEVFKALGVESHVGYHGGNDTDPHNHCSWNASQQETTEKAIRAFLTKTEAPGNFMEPKLKDANDQAVNFDLANYINWDTPQLQ